MDIRIRKIAAVRSYAPYNPYSPSGVSSEDCERSIQSARNEAGSAKGNHALTNAKYDIANSKCRTNAASAAAGDRSTSLACEQARRSYENEASSIRKDWGAINAKKRAMLEECGG